MNECLLWLQSQVEAMDVDEEEEEEAEDEEVLEAKTSMKVDEGSLIVLDSDIEDFRSPEVH